jgi:hypothetical protein
VKFATDYLIKAVVNENTVVMDVGDAALEHPVWGLVDSAGRSGAKIRLCNGADIPATYAAGLALMSTVYRKYDAAYADMCLNKAVVAYKFAKKKLDAGEAYWYCTPQACGEGFYYDYPAVKQINDRLAAAGVELFRATTAKGATTDPEYKVWAQKDIAQSQSCMGYASIGSLASFEVWRQGFGEASALKSNVDFIEGNVKTAGIFKRVYQTSAQGTARDVGAAAFEYALAYVATSDTAARTLYRQRVTDHVDWLCGYNGTSPRSYIIGFNNSPADSIYYRTDSSGPRGGVVSGPDELGNWANDGSSKYCNVGIDYNAGIIGAVAFLKALNNPGTDIQVITPFTATPQSDADLRTETVRFSAKFSSAVPWTLTITGIAGSKTIEMTASTVNYQWDGTADSGFFLAGETVTAKLEVDAEIVAYDLVCLRPVSVGILRMPKPPLGNSDIIVDDFEDGDLNNLVGGAWVPFGTATDPLETTAGVSNQDSSKALLIGCNVLVAGKDAYAGVKSTFNGTGAPVDLGSIGSLVFDLKGSKAANVCVELEQSTIGDGAYYQAVIPITTVSNRYRLGVEEFEQPDWKTNSVPLDLECITSIRFTVYDSTGQIGLVLDSFALENYIATGAVTSPRAEPGMAQPVLTRGALVYTPPGNAAGIVQVTVFDMAGRAVLRKSFDAATGGRFSVPLTRLPAGMYTARQSLDGKVTTPGSRFVLAR